MGGLVCVCVLCLIWIFSWIQILSFKIGVETGGGGEGLLVLGGYLHTSVFSQWYMAYFFFHSLKLNIFFSSYLMVINLIVVKNCLAIYPCNM